MERLTDRQEQFIQDAPPVYQGMVRDAFQGSCGRTRAIKAFCLSCTGFMREEVRHCTATCCPLHAFRPYVKREAISDDEQDENEGEQGAC